MKIVSYNVNGVRSALEKGLCDWIEENQFDVVCLQETKAHSGSVPVLLIESLGYHHHWHSAKRKGYSGGATFTKLKPSKVCKGLGGEKYDNEGRVIRTDLGELTILNCYFPNGGSGPERQKYKMDFLDDFLHWVDNLRQERPNIIVVGDYNIAHQKIDINDPVGNKNSSGFKPEERAWMTARKTNKGWRLDYQSVSDSIEHGIKSVTHMHDAHHSDHCPVELVIDLD